jgi:Uncharacterized conserved protein
LKNSLNKNCNSKVPFNLFKNKARKPRRKTIQEVLQFLNDCRIFYIATVGPDGPKVWPFGFVMEVGGKLYFSTNSTKDVFKQLSADPRFEVSATMPDDMTRIRLKGKAVFDKGNAIREKALTGGSPLFNDL